MTPQQLVATAIRLFAVWLAISGVSLLSSITAATGAGLPNEGHTVAAVLFIGSIYLAAALALWLFPMVVAGSIIPRTKYTDQLSAQPRQLAEVGCALLGVWLLAKSVPSVVWLVLRAFIIVDGSSSFSALNSESKLEIGVALAEATFAVFIILKAGTFARWLVPSSKTKSGSGTESSAEPDVS